MTNKPFSSKILRFKLQLKIWIFLNYYIPVPYFLWRWGHFLETSRAPTVRRIFKDKYLSGFPTCPGLSVASIHFPPEIELRCFATRSRTCKHANDPYIAGVHEVPAAALWQGPYWDGWSLNYDHNTRIIISCITKLISTIKKCKYLLN